MIVYTRTHAHVCAVIPIAYVFDIGRKNISSSCSALLTVGLALCRPRQVIQDTGAGSVHRGDTGGCVGVCVLRLQESTIYTVRTYIHTPQIYTIYVHGTHTHHTHPNHTTPYSHNAKPLSPHNTTPLQSHHTQLYTLTTHYPTLSPHTTPQSHHTLTTLTTPHSHHTLTTLTTLSPHTTPHSHHSHHTLTTQRRVRHSGCCTIVAFFPARS